MDLKLLAKIGSFQQLEPHDFICMENDLGSDMYILLKGKVNVYLNSFMDDAFKVAELNPGAIFGEMSLLEGMPRSATLIVAEEGATVIAVNKNHFEELIQNQEIAYRILSTLRNRVKHGLEQLVLKNEMKAQKFLNNPEYLKIMSINQETFNAIVQKEYEKVYPIVKYLSRTIRTINEQLVDFNGEKQLATAFEIDNDLEFIPKEHQTYSHVINEEFQDIVVDKSMKCPVCEKEFKAPQPKLTKLKLKKIENDLRKSYIGFDPLWVNICTCPNCLYSNYSHEFNILAPKYIKEVKSRLEQATALKSRLTPDVKDINRIFIQYYLAMLCSVSRHMKEIKQGRLWLNLSWLYKDVGDEEMYIYAYTQAFEYYYFTYLNTTYQLSENDEQSLYIILGELYARQEKYDEAKKMLFEVSRIKNGNKQLSNLAAQILYDIKHIAKGE